MKEITVCLCEYLANMGYRAVISNGEVIGFFKNNVEVIGFLKTKELELLIVYTAISTPACTTAIADAAKV